jgi:uncharacterized protein YybS (DUF2232 family)
MNQSKKITDGAVCIGIFVVLLLITLFVPVISIAGLFLLPIPFVIYASRYYFKASFMMFVAAILLSLLFATVFTLPIVVLMGFSGIMIGTSVYKKLSAYETWARGTFGFAIGLLFVFVFSQLVFDVNWVDQLEEMVTESMEMSTSLLKDLGVGQQTDQVQELMHEQMELMRNLLPVVIATIAIFLAFVCQWISYKLLNRLEGKRLYFPPFRTLRFPKAIVWIYFFALIVSLFTSDDPVSTLYIAAENVLMLAGLVMTIQGFSFIFFYAHHKKMSKAIPIISVVLTLIFPTILLFLVRILGIIDIGFGLREQLTQKK